MPSPAFHVFSGSGRGRVLAWRRREFQSAAGDARSFLEELFALVPRNPWRRAEGRETFVWPGREQFVVKRFQSGEARDWWFERMHAGQTPRSPGRREAENLAALEALGIPVPLPLAWAEQASARGFPGPRRVAGRSALVMQRVPIETTLRQALATADGERRALLGARLLQLVLGLHAAGWYHRDLYLEHVVQLEDGGLCLLDLGRARRQVEPRERWFVKDLAALYTSAPGSVNARARLRFLAHWLENRPAEAASHPSAGKNELRRWSRVIERKARRMAAHAPRSADSEGSERALEDARAYRRERGADSRCTC